MARPWSVVHTDDARPYSVPFAQASASSSALNSCTVMTGPNTSCWMISSSWRSPVTTLGSKKYPRLPIRLPPVRTSA